MSKLDWVSLTRVNDHSQDTIACGKSDQYSFPTTDTSPACTHMHNRLLIEMTVDVGKVTHSL